MEPIYLCFVNEANEETIRELPPDLLDEANQLLHFNSNYGKLNYEGHRIGSSKHPIKFAYVNPELFMTLLHMLKRKKEHDGVPFENQYITHHILINYDWQNLWLPKEYLIPVQEMSTESVVQCMCTCSQLGLMELRQLFVYRIIHLLHQKDTACFTMECLVKYASHPYDMLVFQKQWKKLINADSKYLVPTPVREGRSKSF